MKRIESISPRLTTMPRSSNSPGSLRSLLNGEEVSSKCRLPPEERKCDRPGMTYVCQQLLQK